jgi:hypothetical protein
MRDDAKRAKAAGEKVDRSLEATALLLAIQRGLAQGKLKEEVERLNKEKQSLRKKSEQSRQSGSKTSHDSRNQQVQCRARCRSAFSRRFRECRNA